MKSSEGSTHSRAEPMRGRRWLCAAAPLLAALVVGSGCGGNGESSSDSGPIKIGAAVSLTGPLAKLGQDLQRGYQIWEEKVNEEGGLLVNDERRPVELTIEDDQSDGTTSRNLVQKYISQDGTELILGPYSSAIAFQTSTITERAGAIMMITGGTADEIFERGYQNIFAVWPNTTEVLGSAIGNFKKLYPEMQTFGLVSKDDLFSQASRDAAKTAIPKEGLELVVDVTYPENVRDYSTVINKVSEADPDFLLALGHLNDSIGIVKQSREVGFEPKLGWSMVAGPETPDFKKALGPAANGVLYWSLWSPALPAKDPLFGSAADYAAQFEEKFGTPANQNSAVATGAAEVLGLAIQEAGTTEPGPVAEALRAFDGETLNGPIKFNESGVNERAVESMVFYQVQNGEDVLVAPPSVSKATIQTLTQASED